jgi:hypothetical protein
MANPFPFVAGNVLTAAELNGIGDAGTAFTPTWSSSGTQPVLGNGTLVGRYLQINKLVLVYMQLIIGSTTTVGTGSYLFSFPLTAVAVTSGGTIPGSGMLTDASAFAAYQIVPSFSSGSTTNFRAFVFQNSTQVSNTISATVPVVPATGDEYRISYVYEAA